jgi:hypothetical protein
VDVARLLVSLEALGETDLRPALALLAARDHAVDADAVNAAVRRAMLLLAAGGDPHRELELDGRAVSSLAAELDGQPLRVALGTGLEALAPATTPFPRAGAAVAALRRDPELAVRAYACALLAEQLDDEDEPEPGSSRV